MNMTIDAKNEVSKYVNKLQSRYLETPNEPKRHAYYEKPSERKRRQFRKSVRKAEREQEILV